MPYGIAKNRKPMEAIIDYAHQQHILPKKLSVEEVFAKGTENLE
jgi:4,5-dihydroxyphthalate decarboxylase